MEDINDSSPSHQQGGECPGDLPTDSITQPFSSPVAETASWLAQTRLEMESGHPRQQGQDGLHQILQRHSGADGDPELKWNIWNMEITTTVLDQNDNTAQF